MRHLLLPSLLAASLLGAGCSTTEQKMAKAEASIIRENSRSTEQRKMNAMTYGDAASERGAEVLVWDPNKSFDPSRSGIGAARSFGTGGAQVKSFNADQQARTGNFLTRTFSGSKSNSALTREYATMKANTAGKYDITNVDKKAGQKTALTKELADGTKVASTKDLHDGDRTYLGPERRKLGNSLDPAEMGDWRKSSSESVSYNGTSVDRVGNLKQLSIEDVRELLNKNK